jgi:hypothetical protein
MVPPDAERIALVPPSSELFVALVPPIATVVPLVDVTTVPPLPHTEHATVVARVPPKEEPSSAGGGDTLLLQAKTSSAVADNGRARSADFAGSCIFEAMAENEGMLSFSNMKVSPMASGREDE